MDNKKLMIECEARAQARRLVSKLPNMKKKSHAKAYGDSIVLSGEEGNKKLIAAIESGKPYMCARFGTSEGRCTYNYLKIKNGLMSGEIPEADRLVMTRNAGFFPNDNDLLIKFCEQELEACKSLDMLGRMNFLGEEYIYRAYCGDCDLMPTSAMGPQRGGWTEALAGKKILVVHPFAQSIKSQYENKRELLFPGTDILPEFDLQVIKAVQTIADEKDDRFDNWFEALDYMSDEIAKRDFEIAIIGCGAYGFQLADRVKRLGKQAFHIGGTVQLIFGIKGSRWDRYSEMYNDAWIYPSEAETPKGFEKIEGGCYWKKQ